MVNGLHVVKEVVWFFIPVSNRAQLITVEPDLRRAVRSADEANKGTFGEREIMKWKTVQKNNRGKEKLIDKKEFLADSGEDLNNQEQKAREELKAATELLKDAKSKLDDILHS